MATSKRGMRKGLTAYGDEEFSLFLRKAFVKAMGYTDDALDRPIVGITNTFSDFNPCHGNVPDLIAAVNARARRIDRLDLLVPDQSMRRVELVEPAHAALVRRVGLSNGMIDFAGFCHVRS